MNNFKDVLSKTFKKGLSNDGYGVPYPDTPLPFAKRVEDRRDSGRHKGA